MCGFDQKTGKIFDAALFSLTPYDIIHEDISISKAAHFTFITLLEMEI